MRWLGGGEKGRFLGRGYSLSFSHASIIYTPGKLSRLFYLVAAVCLFLSSKPEPSIPPPCSSSSSWAHQMFFATDYDADCAIMTTATFPSFRFFGSSVPGFLICTYLNAVYISLIYRLFPLSYSIYILSALSHTSGVSSTILCFFFSFFYFFVGFSASASVFVLLYTVAPAALLCLESGIRIGEPLFVCSFVLFCTFRLCPES